jgi:hypothetical protein
MQTERKPAFKRIAICAQSFGFGPVSKACAIAKALLEGCQGLELVYIADSISKEFMKREGLWKDGRDITIGEDEDGVLKRQDFEYLDAAVVVLDPKMASFFHPWVPTYFVDSLGFMWDTGFFQQFPHLQEINIYFVQDIFGAKDRLAAKGVKNLYPVGAIIDTRVSLPDDAFEMTFHLGGLINIFARVPIQTYVEGIIPIVEKLAAGQHSVILTSHVALDAFEILRTTNIPVRDLPHDQVLGLFTQSRSVFTSPGLTTLLELMSLQVPVIPLPPQNMSQALIISNLVTHWRQAPEIWGFLAKHYPLTHEMSEEEGVRMVQTINARLLNRPDFQEAYIHLALKAREPTSPLPSHLVLNLDGVGAIRNTIYRDLDLLPVSSTAKNKRYEIQDFSRHQSSGRR